MIDFYSFLETIKYDTYGKVEASYNTNAIQDFDNCNVVRFATNFEAFLKNLADNRLPVVENHGIKKMLIVFSRKEKIYETYDLLYSTETDLISSISNPVVCFDSIHFMKCFDEYISLVMWGY